MIVATTDHSPLLSLEATEAVLEKLYGRLSLRTTQGDSTSSEFRIYIHPENETSFGAYMLTGGDSLSLDGLPEQNIRVAAAVRAAMPRDAVRTVLLDYDMYRYVDLKWGITIEDVNSGWQSIDEGGFENL